MHVMVVPDGTTKAQLDFLIHKRFENGTCVDFEQILCGHQEHNDIQFKTSSVLEYTIPVRGGMNGTMDHIDVMKIKTPIRSDIKEILDVCNEKVQKLKMRCSDLVDKVKRDIIRSKSQRRFSLDVRGSHGSNVSNPDMGATPFPTGEEIQMRVSHSP
jgi:hypothetical protein